MKKTTQKIIIFFTLFLIIVDVIFYFMGRTISEDVKHIGDFELVFLPWVWGVLASHLFFTRKKDDVVVNEKIGILILIIIAFLIYLTSSFIPEETPISGYPKLFFMIGGMIIGYFLWPQIKKQQLDNR